MARSPISFRLQGERALERKLKLLPQAIIKKELRKAVNKAATPIVKRAKQLVTRRSGLLKKSIAKKVKTYSSGKVVAIIGSRREVAGFVDGKPHRPAYIAHLVEEGHGGPRPAPPYPFLRPAFEATVRQSLNVMKESLTASILAIALKK